MTRALITALSLTIAVSFSSAIFAAGMQNQLDNIFNQMQNYTAPGAYETQRRSAYFGGRYTMKNAIYNENLVAMQLPSARGGCGGIDIFGGSFSFINSDQLVQLLRQVASNAQGYAFQLAMDNMCPNCMEWMNELQIKMQGLNENMSNSCQLAQGLVNDTVNLVAHKKREETDQSLMGSLKGFGEDFLDLSQHVTTADTAVKRIFDADPAEFNEQTGADVYKALMRNSAQSWFVGGDQELIETIMSMTGSIVVGELVPGKDGQGETPQIWTLPGNLITMEDLIEGASGKQIYNCAADSETDHCRITPADKQSIDIEGLKQKILLAFTGPSGLITWIRTKNVNGTLDIEQQNILAAMPHAIGSKIFELAPISPEAAEQLVTSSIDAITLEYIYQLTTQAFQAVEKAMSTNESAYKSVSIAEITSARDKIHNEYKVLTGRYGAISQIESHYNALMENVQKPKYISAGNQAGDKTDS